MIGIFGIFPRAGAILLAIILIIVSAATIGVINNNNLYDELLDVDDPDNLPDEFQDVRNLYLLSQGAAVWLIALNIGIVIAEIIAIILVIVNLEGTGKIVIAVLEIVFSILALLCYLATGIACATYAAAWGEPPDLCELIENSPSEDEIGCDHDALTATNALEAVFCFIQIGAFGLIIFMTILGLSTSRQTA